MQENSGIITRKQLQITAHLYRKEATALLGTAVSTHMIGRLSTIVVAETTECSDGRLFGFVEFESSCILKLPHPYALSFLDATQKSPAAEVHISRPRKLKATKRALF